ncbi:16S rRNA (guanine(527)-N(7))-methyltransferase RsmG [Salisediminibacterium halotolerans]|uniref:16S rRNA (guanine(527)-N(7))-methyltransferase RsmG n=1 Tax=Salisediminibacterium halotolerans TaxID=517425 RepID=UPI000EB2C056|nr:16S rRNA (guanine(527)-N(7))-methyltransferase RsmG [Salisediminibacterium halotolerans]RLJ69727.1 16S rRNA m(7)G-527 methyltransferase [Actinophytocola xinjiangensis]RPE89785.1 16S rRNA m(7)G-527 methyltransferase [Salisediminibacterium halotolerans]TWG32621.1 16S rRNA m(7)G-527 methyltransferase [Salisediminibacterium halotolerans]GEL07567.1 ribosomal RNA small subunit methyltransferase G [Salisediminibacterium halotolerans]
MDEETFRRSLLEKGIELNDRQMAQFRRYYELLADWNERMNLTAITDAEGVYLKHFYDSVTAAFFLDFSKPVRVLDVGAGAGFPSVPLKICFPDIHVSIVDSLNKRITFLNTLAEELELTGISFYHDRAETFAQKKEQREQYDLVLSRAVARMSVLTELCLPFAVPGGRFAALKGAGAAAEKEAASKAIAALGGEVSLFEQFHLPENGGERAVIVVDKKKKTPEKYPRKAGVPNKQPIE